MKWQFFISLICAGFSSAAFGCSEAGVGDLGSCATRSNDDERHAEAAGHSLIQRSLSTTKLLLNSSAADIHEDAVRRSATNKVALITMASTPFTTAVVTDGSALTAAQQRRDRRIESLESSELKAEPGLHRKQSTDLLKTIAAPTIALALGLALLSCGNVSIAAKLLVFFGAQTFMNLYMKAMLSEVVVSDNLIGIQAPFAITAIQQVVGVILLILLIAFSQLTPWPYTPKILTTRREWLPVMGAFLCFSVNIGLNNLSLSLLDLSTNMMIRSSAPVTTLMMQVIMSRWLQLQVKQHSAFAIICLVLGVICGGLVIAGKAHGAVSKGDMHTYWVGVTLCVTSLLAAALELVFLKSVGDTSKLNPVDTVLHIGVPVALVLCIPSWAYAHPVQWHGYGYVTDWKVIQDVWTLNNHLFWLAICSGGFSVAYNIILYSLVQTLSPTAAAVTSNFNKVATIGIAILFGMDSLPPGNWAAVTTIAIGGNLLSFTFYGVSQVTAERHSAPEDEGSDRDRAQALVADALDDLAKKQAGSKGSPAQQEKKALQFWDDLHAAKTPDGQSQANLES